MERNYERLPHLGLMKNCKDVLQSLLTIHLSGNYFGDLIATDAVYHFNCLTKIYRQAAKIESKENDEVLQTNFLKAQAFAYYMGFNCTKICHGHECQNNVLDDDSDNDGT